MILPLYSKRSWSRMYTTHYISIISYYSGYLVECLGGNMNREGHRVAVKLRVTAKNQTFSSGPIVDNYFWRLSKMAEISRGRSCSKPFNFGQQAANFLPRISKDFDIGNSPSHIRIAMLIIFCNWIIAC